MKVSEAKCKIVPAKEITTMKGLKILTRGSGTITFQIDQEERQKIEGFLSWLINQNGWKKMDLSLTVEKWYEKKSYDQVKLFWALVEILCVEQDGKVTEELKLEYYKGLLSLYAPRVKAKITGEEIVKTLSEMNTYEASRLIEGTFRELSLIGVSIDESQNIKNYWIEWRNWRGKAKKEKWDTRSIEEYREAVPYCEACLQGGDHMAHIISKGAGAKVAEAGYFLHLCTEHHIWTQHTKGWVKLLEEFPHLIWKVNQAREKWGLPLIKKADDLFSEAGEEVAEIEDETQLDIF